jgi:hypothetical protein
MVTELLFGGTRRVLSLWVVHSRSHNEDEYKFFSTKTLLLKAYSTGIDYYDFGSRKLVYLMLSC